MDLTPWRHHLVLAGGGHTHALVLRHWIMRPRHRPRDTQITLVSRYSTFCYSGLVPGVLAGLYPPHGAQVDLRRLCAFADVTFVMAEIEGLACDERALLLRGRPPLGFDRLSLDVGAVTSCDPRELAVKPLEPLLAWSEGELPLELRIRGAGASAVEVALALRARGLRPQVLARGPGLDLGSRAANRLAEGLLQTAAIPLLSGVGDLEPADLACTGSRAPLWLATAGLPLDVSTGRVLTESTLQVIDHPWVFASGDCALVRSHPRPPSGVWAVRAAPVLAANLERILEERPLLSWRPQRWALQLLGDGGVQSGTPQALAIWGPLVLGPSPWLWRWKRHLDQDFLSRFNKLRPMAVPDATPMPCRGCAAKLPARPLRNALTRLASSDFSVHPPLTEDAPLVMELPHGQRLLQSVDGFPALVTDPWLNGRLTVLHACSDLWASGGSVQSVQAVVTLPLADPRLQEDLLLQTLAGLRSVVDPLGASLLGGHTLEGRDGAGLGVIVTVNGLAPSSRHWKKGPLRPGDALLITRPIGTGVLFAAAMAGAASPLCIDAALAVMGQSQAPLVDLLATNGCHACTDITGFGLLGHLAEMLNFPSLSGCCPAEETVRQVFLDPTRIPVLPGVMDLLAKGYASSLAPANAETFSLLARDDRLSMVQPLSPALRGLLIDPQTCGPLLAALPQDCVPMALASLHAAGFGEAAVIGWAIGS